MALMKIGHRSRGIQHDLTDIPMLLSGTLLAQQFGVDWYVNSANAVSGPDGRTPDSAVTTLAAAVALAASGDRIYLAPGHSETIASAGGITISKAGLTIIGLGSGSARPLFTWSAVGSTWAISGNNTVISNIRVTSSVDEMVLMFNVTGSFVVLDRVDHFETASAQTIAFAAFTTGTDCTIQNCAHYQATAAAANQIWITATSNTRFKVLNCQFFLTLKDVAAAAVIFCVTCTMVLIRNCDVHLTGFSANMLSAFLSLNTTTGIVAYCNIFAPVTANTTLNDMPGCASFQVLGTNALDKNGILDPIADT